MVRTARVMTSNLKLLLKQVVCVCFYSFFKHSKLLTKCMANESFLFRKPLGVGSCLLMM